MQRVKHQQRLYPIDAERAASSNIRAIAALVEGESQTVPSTAARERKLFTRAVDASFLFTRKYFPTVHVAGAATSALILLIYAWILALTVRLVSASKIRLPDVPSGCVLAVWHGSAPSLLVALHARMPAFPLAILVACDPRGDCLAWFCQLLGLQVVRGDSEHGGWEALTVLAQFVERGACAVITADGGGPSRQAKAGAVALASATGSPLVALGADCRPAISERRKWDRARIPLPFCRVAITVAEARTFQLFNRPHEVESARLWLQSALDAAAERCREVLVPGSRAGMRRDAI